MNQTVIQIKPILLQPVDKPKLNRSNKTGKDLWSRTLPTKFCAICPRVSLITHQVLKNLKIKLGKASKTKMLMLSDAVTFLSTSKWSPSRRLSQCANIYLPRNTVYLKTERRPDFADANANKNETIQQKHWRAFRMLIMSLRNSWIRKNVSWKKKT